MEENELKEDEMSEDVVQQNAIEENEFEQDIITEDEQELQKKPLVDWEQRNLGSKAKDIGLIGFFISPAISALATLIVKTQEMADLLTKIYIYLPLAIGLAGIVLSIIGLVKSKGKWNSVIGLLLNLLVVGSAILLIIRIRMQGGQ